MARRVKSPAVKASMNAAVEGVPGHASNIHSSIGRRASNPIITSKMAKPKGPTTQVIAEVSALNTT